MSIKTNFFLNSSHLKNSRVSTMDLRKSYESNAIKPFYVGAPAAAVSVDGRLMVTPLDEDIVITDLELNEVLHTIEGDGEPITNVAITPDGKWIAAISQLQQLRVFDAETGDQKKAYKLPSPVYISAADRTSSLFAFGGADGVITIWDVSGSFVTHSLKGHGTTVCLLAFHGNLGLSDWRLASGDTMGTAKVWDLVKRKCIGTVQEHTSAVRGVAFGPEGRLLTAGRDAVVVLYNERYKAAKTIAVGHQVECAGFIDGDNFYTAGSGGNIQMWNIELGHKVSELLTPVESSEELVVIDVLGISSGWLMVLSDQTITELDEELTEVKRIAGNHGTVADIRYIPNLDAVAMATNSPALRIMFRERPLEVVLLEQHKDLLNAVDVSSDGVWIATASKDTEAALWRRKDEWENSSSPFDLFATFKGHAGAVTAISLPKTFTGVPSFLLTGSADLTVKKWAVKEGVISTSIYTRRAHEKDINKIDISPNDEFFATASYDKLGKVWDVNTGETIGVLKGHKRGLWDISFCEYDKILATSSGDKLVKIWLLNDFTCQKTLEGHTNSVQRVHFINKNSQVISAGADGLVKVWDLKNEEALKTLDGHDNRIWALDVQDDGELFVTADADGRITYWTDNSDELAAAESALAAQKVEQEQKLSNYINNNDWLNAFLLALTLDHPMRLYTVLKRSIGQQQDPELKLGLNQIDETISKLDNQQILKLFQRTREWNVNLKSFEVAQKLLLTLLQIFATERLLEIRGINTIIDGILAYSERHFGRVESVVEDSFMLDWVVGEMGRS